jgi:hypothetical protein
LRRCWPLSIRRPRLTGMRCRHQSRIDGSACSR